MVSSPEEMGTYYQNVPLIGIATDRDKTSLSFAKNGAMIGGH